MGVLALRVGATCSLHRLHRPRALTGEWHHVVPQAWQHWLTGQGAAPAPFVGPGPVQQTGGLWDPRVIGLCPTGHRNVHHWIVAMVRALEAAGSDDPLTGWVAVRPRVPPAEFAVAYDALTRFRAAGSLLALAAAGLYGEA